MKKILLGILTLVGVSAATVAGAYYNDNCSSANNFCGGTVYRCDIYCTGKITEYDYCNKYCANWTNNNNYYTSPGYVNYTYTNYNSSYCYYDSWGTYRCDNSYNNPYYYNNYSYNYGYSSSYPYWYPTSYWWWNQDDLNLMTQSLNSDAIQNAKKPDFFDAKIIRKDNNWKRLNAINIGKYSLKSEDMKEKYEDSKKFISALKDAIWQRYADGVIKNYQMADIINNLNDTVYNLNMHFSYTVQYEKTKKSLYDELAMEKLDEVKTNYDRLKASLKWRN